MASSSAVTLTNTGFIYGGCEHAYDQVTSLCFYHEVTKVSVLLFHAGNEHKADLDIYAEGLPKPIKIRTGFSLNPLADNPMTDNYAASQKRAKSVVALYEHLAKQTFQFRLQRYVNMMDKHGFFFYDSKKVFADGRISDGNRQLNFNTDRPIHRKPFEVYFETKKTPGEHLLNVLVWRQDFIISTKHDADVFFFLIKRLFGLEWK
jgi:hypothetical protein